MTDWSKYTVVNLKEECKARDIPLTGLKLKQQYIDKLQEYEATKATDDDVQPDAVDNAPKTLDETSDKTNGHQAQNNQTPTSAQDDKPEAIITDTAAERSVTLESNENTQLLETPKVDVVNEDTHPSAQGEDTVMQDEESQDIEAQQPEIVQTNRDTELASELQDDVVPLVSEVKESTIFIPEPAGIEEKIEVAKEEMARAPEEVEAQQPPIDSPDDRPHRRKRSVSPVEDLDDNVHKRPRLSSALEEMKAETDLAKDIRGELLKGSPPQDSGGPKVEQESTMITEDTTSPPEPQNERAESEEREVTPAIHPATSSLYIRNFKRPLHVPTLRTHIQNLAKSRSDEAANDPIITYFVDPIRTHAFIQFTSITAASRVRAAMHGTKFPDETMRDPLFVDFIPDEKIQAWIDEETGSNSFGGRSSNRRFEVVYAEGSQGTEAIFQEVDSRNAQRPSITSRPSFDQPRNDPIAPGIHPDRAGLVGPRDQTRDRPYDRSKPAPPTGPRQSNGVGFKALDDLFPSTIAKPKLYYKPVSAEVAESRRDMLQELRDMGRSGDADMKRYTFERVSKNREEWVDKGPEFGRGRKGQDRLAGYRGGRGGGGGGGGFRGRGGGDSWRGGR